MKRLTLIALLAAFAIAGCDSNELADDRDRLGPAELTAAEKAVVAADNRFGFELLQTLVEADPGSNVFISPISVSMALGMTANGAAGETRDAMVTTLGKDHLDPEAVNQSYRSLKDRLPAIDPGVTVEIANSIWYAMGFPVLAPFLEAGQTWFDAEIREENFDDPAAVDRVNAWAEDNTHGLVKDVLSEIDPSVVMLLMNAVYFKGTWQYRFDPADTAPSPFTNADGTVTDVPMMQMEATLPVLFADRFTAFDLAYGDSLYSMSVLVPSDGTTAQDLVMDLDQETWNAWASQFQRRNVVLFMPRFEVSYRESLIDALTSLGMGVAFAPGRADFSRISDVRDLYIGDVIHQTAVIVNEEGTEAAAVTVVVVEVTSIGSFIQVDRPFVFMIRERTSGTILFIGIINALS